jgi:hypothetical protein
MTPCIGFRACGHTTQEGSGTAPRGQGPCSTICTVLPGRALFTLVRAEEGIGVFGLANRKFPLSRGVLRRVAPLLIGLVQEIRLAGKDEEDRFFLYFALQAMMRARLIMYAPTIPLATQVNLPFVKFMSSSEGAIQGAASRIAAADTLVFPYGGITYAILPC